MSAEYSPPAGPTSRAGRFARLRPALRYWPLVVPVALCAVIFGMMRPDGLKAREEIPPGWKWMIYDETDFGALVLRGANAHIGRRPARLEEPDIPAGWETGDLAADLDRDPPVEYSERFYFEYPAPTLFLFRLPYLLDPDARGLVVPAAAADRFQYSIGQYVPRADPGHETERRVWGC